MRTRKPITRDAILAALDEAGHDVEAAAVVVSRELGQSVSGRTLYRRMREYGIQRTDRYVLEEEAA